MTQLIRVLNSCHLITLVLCFPDFISVHACLSTIFFFYCEKLLKTGVNMLLSSITNKCTKVKLSLDSNEYSDLDNPETVV